MASTPATRTALEPLRALRYNPEFVELGDVVAPPYDVISAADRDAYPRRTAHLRPVSGAPARVTTDADGTVHRFWQVTDSGAIEAVQEAMGERSIVIADGHHRYETALAYRDEIRGREGDSPTDLPCDFVLM